MNVNTKFYLAMFIALMMDGFDFIVGWIPLAGDIIDVIGIVFLFPLIGKYALVGGAEFVPFLDFLPFFSFAVVMWKIRGGS